MKLASRLRSVALFEQPGLVTGAADDDPSGRTMVLTCRLMTAVQLVSAHLGRVTHSEIGKSTASRRLLFFGWAATVVMAVAAMAMVFVQ